jgi:hypothetical protein
MGEGEEEGAVRAGAVWAREFADSESRLHFVAGETNYLNQADEMC